MLKKLTIIRERDNIKAITGCVKKQDKQEELMFLRRQIEIGIIFYKKMEDKKLGKNLVRLINEYREKQMV
jgi:hypothetical protein